MSKVIKRQIDMANLPPLTAKQKAELAALAAAPEGEIDMTDIAKQSSAFWRAAQRGQFYKPLKSSTTVRMDADVLAWLKSQGKGYQTRINAILRDAMLRALEPSVSTKKSRQ